MARALGIATATAATRKRDRHLAAESLAKLEFSIPVGDAPLAERRAAVLGFAAAVQRCGLLLKRNEILLQYDRYNQSETLDAGTQQVLSDVLDAIEAPSKKMSRQDERDPNQPQPNDA